MGRPVRRVAALVLASLLALLGACASRPSAPRPGPEGRDGPGASPPPNLAQVPDAVPRIEPLRTGGPNKPYEMLGQRYVPLTSDAPLSENGLASWYGRKFHGLPTSSGEPYDMYAMTAAHRTMPIPSYARVRNPANGREVVVRINDRGPFAPGRVIDLSYTAALKLGVLSGVAPVQVQRLTSDDIRTLARLAPRPPLPPDDPAPGDASPAAAGWWLQLGAYRVREVAAVAQERLLRDSALVPGVAVVEVVEENGWFRVQAGPYASREDAVQGAEQLQRRTGHAVLLVQRGGRQPP